jgi:hypothetical protein
LGDNVKSFSSASSVIGEKEFIANARIESGRLSARPRGRPKKK